MQLPPDQQRPPGESKLRAPWPTQCFSHSYHYYLSLPIPLSCLQILLNNIDNRPILFKINTNSYSSFMYFNLVNDIICLKINSKLSELLLVYSVPARRRIESFNLIYISSGKAMPSNLAGQDLLSGSKGPGGVKTGTLREGAPPFPPLRANPGH